MSTPTLPPLRRLNSLSEVQKNNNLISPEEIVVVNGLGMGGFGVVVEVAATGFDGRLAMKCMSKERYFREKNRRDLTREIQVLTTLDPSPFLLKCVLAFETNSEIFLVTELLSGGDLFFNLDQMIEQHGREGFPEDQARVLLAEISMGLCHLHARGFVHRDIKIENIMLTGDGHVKLVDFGLVSELPVDDTVMETPMRTGGSLIYIAPEQIKRKICGRFTDWWAVGILAYELLTGHSPWSTLDDTKQVMLEIVYNQVDPPSSVSTAAGEFITSLLRKDYRLRLGTYSDRDVLAAPFFFHIDVGALERGENQPAFAPNSDVASVTREDAEAAFDAYCGISRKARATSRTAPFEMGLLKARRAPSTSFGETLASGFTSDR